jgi:hypothetical protein
MSTEYKTMSLRECAKFDADTGAKNKLTGWGKISKDRQERGISRKQRRLKREASK